MAPDIPETATLAELEQSLDQPGTTAGDIAERITAIGLSSNGLDEGLHAAVLLKEKDYLFNAARVFQRLTSRWPDSERIVYEYIQFLRRSKATEEADNVLIRSVERGITGENILRECVVRALVERQTDNAASERIENIMTAAVAQSGSTYIKAVVDYLSCVDSRSVLSRLRQYKQPTLEIVYERCLMAVSNSTPFCLLRLGDGEGAFLHPPMQHRANALLFQAHANFFANRWYGSVNLASDPGFLATVEVLRAQVHQADIVGAPQADWLMHEVMQRNLRSIVCCLELVQFCQQVGFDRSDQMTTTTVAIDLEFRHLIAALMKASRSISLITCHTELASRLLARGRVSVRQTMLIPPAFSDLARTGYGTHDAHFPVAFDEVNRMIDTIPAGELVLIGAGFLGKLYALRVKERGGIALDVGSLFDLWMGFVTRPGFVDLKHMVLSAHESAEVPREARLTGSETIASIGETRAIAEVNEVNERMTRSDNKADEADPGLAEIDFAARALSDGAEPIHWIKEALRHRDNKRHDIADGILRHVIEHHPTVESAYYELAFLHRVRRDPRQATQVLDRALGQASSNRIQLLHGHMLYACEAYDEGVAALNRIEPEDAAERETLNAMFAFGAYLRQFPLGRAVRMVDQQKARSGWLDATALAQRIGTAIQARAPFALVRLGDGEGGMLKLNVADEAAYEALYDRNRRELTRIWFGGSFDWRNGSFLRDAQNLPQALVQCDVIGIPYESWVRHEYGISSLRGVPSLVNVYRLLQQDDVLGQKPVCSQHAHLDLFQDGHLVPLIKAAGHLSVITCLPEVAGLLRDRFDLDDVRLHLIPAEQRSVAILGEQAGTGVHYPDAYRRVQRELAVPHAGRLFLVAAGLLGKFYCAVIRNNGGIALDIGSLVDGWAGRPTRPGYDQRLKL